MKVLLFEDVKDLGWLGDIVDVADGYARNYLLPQGIGKPATEANIKSIADEKARRAEQRIQEAKRLQAVAEAITDAEAVIASKANEQGHLFGSVTEKDIAANLREQGFSVADDVVRLAEHIKDVGEHEATLKFSPEIKVTVKVTVVPELSEEEAAAQAAAAEEAAKQETADEAEEPAGQES